MAYRYNRRGWAELRFREPLSREEVARLVSGIGQIPGIHVWETGLGLELHETTANLPEVREALVRLVGEAPVFELSTNRRALERLALWGRLYPWQHLAAARIAATSRYLLADDMGLGKTRSAIAAAAAHMPRQRLDDGTYVLGGQTIIIGPAYAREVWRMELERFFGDGGPDGKVADYGAFCALKTRDFNDSSYRKDAVWLFVHYDIVYDWATHFAVLAQRGYRPTAVIVDEAHAVKEARTLRAKGTLGVVSLADVRILLTGTPLENRPSELWSLLTMLHGSRAWGHAGEFRARYCGAVRNNFGLEDGEPTNVDELRQRMAPYYLRRVYSDIAHQSPDQLPPFGREQLASELTAAQAAKHDELLGPVGQFELDEIVSALVWGRAGEKALRLLGALRKVTSAAKLPATKAHVLSLLEQGRSVVVFGWQRETVAALHKAFERAGHAAYLVSGEKPQALRDASVAAFQASVVPSVLVATYGTLREGVTLTQASEVVLHDLDWKLSVILQAEKRVHRLTQTKPCTSWWAVADNSIDSIFARLLVKKGEHAQTYLGIEEGVLATHEVGLVCHAMWDAADWARQALRGV